VEWKVGAPSTQVWVDGDLALDVGTAPPLSLAITNIGLSVGYPASQYPSYEMWIDDLIIDDKPIGCAK
jgi:hypothetical protein